MRLFQSYRERGWGRSFRGAGSGRTGCTLGVGRERGAGSTSLGGERNELGAGRDRSGSRSIAMGGGVTRTNCGSGEGSKRCGRERMGAGVGDACCSV